MFSKKYIIIAGLLGLLALGRVLTRPTAPTEPTLIFPTQNWLLQIEIADAEAERNRGLSGRASLPADSGLFFIFEAVSQPGFWMKDMNFPIDIIWIDEDWRIVGITANATPNSYPQIFYPPAPIKYALEINAGLSAKHHLQIGDPIEFAVFTSK